MSKSKQKKATISSPINFNDLDLLERVSGVDYARVFYLIIVVNRLDLDDTKIFVKDLIHEYCQKYSPSRQQS